MSQTRKQSIIEVVAGQLLAFAISMFVNAVMLPLFNMHPTISDSFWITLIFTVVSLVRSYWTRRIFNWLFRS